MSLISNLKRSGYVGAALVLLLAAMPITPIGRMIVGDDDAMAAPADHKVTNGSRTTLQNYLNSYGEAMLASNVSSNNSNGQVQVSRNGAILDLGGYDLNVNLAAGNNVTVTIYATGGGRMTRTLSAGNGSKFVIYGGTFTNKPQDAWIATGYEAVQNATDNSWTVQKAAVTAETYLGVNATKTLGQIIDSTLIPTNAVRVDKESSDTSVVDFTNATNDCAIVAKGVGSATATCSYVGAGNEVLFKAKVTVNTYQVTEGAVVLMEGSTVNASDAVIGSFSTPEEIVLKLVRGDSEAEAVTLTGTTVANGVITANAIAGTDTLHFCASESCIGDDDLGQKEIRVFKKQAIEDQKLSASGTGAPTRTTINIVDGGNMPGYTVTSSNRNVVTVTNAGNGAYTLRAISDGEATITIAYAGEGVLGEPEETFKVTVADVYEIVLDEDEYYVEADAAQKFTVKERNNNGSIRARILDADGGTVNDATISCNRKMSNYREYECNFSADEAGEYTVEIRVQNRQGTRVYATENVKMHVYDFEVSELEYHVRGGDSANKFISAVNRYWGNTNVSGAFHSDGSDASQIRINSANGGYNFRMSRMGVESDKYTLNVSALVGAEAVATKTVDIYVYNMTHPSQSTYYGEIDASGNAYTFSGIEVDDDLNKVDGLDGIAQIMAEVTSGDASAVDLSEFESGKVTISKPGVYEVKYTDKMKYGNGADADDDTWTATFNVYGLAAKAEQDVFLNMNAGQAYTYTIDPANTYGSVRTTVTYEDTEGNTTRISRTEKRYNGNGDAVEEYTIDPSTYGEGKYTVEIENRSVGRHQLPALEAEGTFYAVAREYDFVMVEQGKEVKIESGSDWSVDYAYEYSTGNLTVDDKKVVLDTSELELGTTRVVLGHEFDNGEDWALKTVTVVVYKVVPAGDTKELNPEVTTATIKDLYDKTAAATAKLIKSMIANGMPEILVEYGGYSTMMQMLMGDLTDEEVAAMLESLTAGLTEEEIAELGLTELFKDYKAAFADERDKTGAQTAAILNLLNSEIFGLSGAEITTDVHVEEINNSISDAEKAKIEKKLAKYNVDHIDYYDVSVLIKVRGYEVGKLHQLNGKVTVALAKTTDPATGYTRQYFVTRTHNGEVVVLEEGKDFYIKNGVIYVKSDLFSTYAVAYKDTLKTGAPDTGVAGADEAGSASANASVLTAVVAMLAVLGLAGIAKFAKKRS